MSVDLNPEELGFRRPFNHEVTQILRIINKNSGSVAFKVKTTAPKQYCVRPNSGLVKAGSAVDVQVLLQAMKEDPPLDARCRDKFLVQSVLVDDSEETNVATLWSNVEKTSKSSIQERKIRVSFLPAGDATTSQANGLTSEEQPPAYSSPAATVYGSPAPPSTSDSKSTPSVESAKASASASNAADSAATTASNAAAAVVNALPQSTEEVKQQLAAAQARISELTSQLADPQVRQRKVAEAQEKVQTIVQQSQESGVPIHIVAALCLVSFLIAYLFF